MLYFSILTKSLLFLNNLIKYLTIATYQARHNW